MLCNEKKKVGEKKVGRKKNGKVVGSDGEGGGRSLGAKGKKLFLCQKGAGMGI